MKSRYAASVEGGTTWRIVEPGSIYEARRGSTPKGIIYTRSLKDMADRGQKLTDAESWEFLATAATATRGPDQGRSVQAYRFERVVPRASSRGSRPLSFLAPCPTSSRLSLMYRAAP